MERPVRVRFAPSPTGALHIGGVRTALYNYLFARQHGGQFLVRIEDTDQERFVEGAEEYIFETLRWLGIPPDESPEVGGKYAPYRQSERRDLYKQYIQILLDKGHAYYAFDTKEEIEELRQRLEAAKSTNPSYNALTRNQMRNSLTLPADEVERLLQAGEPHVVRLKTPAREEIRFHDLIRGAQYVHSSTLDDKVLMKQDGLPTYHFANVVDDYLMGITHVFRGEEWLPSAPSHILLYQFFGWEKEMPLFAHLPLILAPDGTKLSKRKASEYGIPVFPLQWFNKETNEDIKGFRENGYLPEALTNFLALIGWNAGTDQEIFSLDELVQAFKIEQIHKAGAKFDIDKAKWYNEHYLRHKDNAELASLLQSTNTSIGKELAEKLVVLMKDRATFPADMWQKVPYLFASPAEFDQAVVGDAKKWNDDAKSFIKELATKIADFAGEWSAENIKHFIHEIAEAKGVKIGKLMQAIRVATTGAGQGPDLMLILEILGKGETQARWSRAEQI